MTATTSRDRRAARPTGRADRDASTADRDASTADRGSATDAAERLRLSATRLARLLRQQADTGLTPTQLAALATIQRRGPLPVGTLAEIEQVAAPTATKVVDKLHGAGLVDRVTDPDDRRVSLVSPTPAGHDLLRGIRAQKTAWLATRLAELPPGELALLTDALDVLEHLTTAAAKPEPRPAAPATAKPTKPDRPEPPRSSQP